MTGYRDEHAAQNRPQAGVDGQRQEPARPGLPRKSILGRLGFLRGWARYWPATRTFTVCSPAARTKTGRPNGPPEEVEESA